MNQLSVHVGVRGLPSRDQHIVQLLHASCSRHPSNCWCDTGSVKHGMAVVHVRSRLSHSHIGPEGRDAAAAVAILEEGSPDGATQGIKNQTPLR